MKTLVIAPFFLLIVLFVIGATIGMAGRRARVVRPAHFHWIVRVLCAVLVLAALVAVGVGTWRGTSAELDSPAVRVSLPTHAPQPLPRATEPGEKVDLGPTQLIATVLLARKARDQFVPLCGESRTLDWPVKGNPELVFEGEVNGSSYKVQMNLSEFMKWNDGESIQATQGIRVDSKGTTWSRGGGMMLALDTLQIETFGHFSGQLDHAPLSILPVGTGQDLRLLVHLTRADRDDPLRQVSASEWLNGEGRKLPRDDDNWKSSHPSQFESTLPPGFRMFGFLGPSVLLLLLAAAAGSALFPHGRRALGFTGLLTCMVLYAGALDALILERRARLVADASQPENVRVAALACLQEGTFFHTGKAAARLRQIAADPATPAFLRASAEAE